MRKLLLSLFLASSTLAAPCSELSVTGWAAPYTIITFHDVETSTIVATTRTTPFGYFATPAIPRCRSYYADPQSKMWIYREGQQFVHNGQNWLQFLPIYPRYEETNKKYY